MPHVILKSGGVIGPWAMIMAGPIGDKESEPVPSVEFQLAISGQHSDIIVAMSLTLPSPTLSFSLTLEDVSLQVK